MTRQSWDPERYARNARFVSDLGMPVVELLAPQPGERILDLGCGDGALTQKLVDMGCVVVGVDGSADQVAAALFGLHVNARTARVDAVFQQLLDHTGGPFDDLARGDLVNNHGRQGLDTFHGVAPHTNQTPPA